MRGALAKEQIFQKMLEVFDGSFMYNGGKELRIPFDEEGNLVQIKVALTCAKDNVFPDGAAAVPVATSATPASDSGFPPPLVKNKVEAASVAAPTEEEKKNVEDLLKALGL